MLSMRRHAVSIAAAVMLPILILAGLQLYTLANAQRMELEALARSRSEELIRLVDAQLVADAKLAQVLASSVPMVADDIPGAYARAREFVQIARTWRTVRLTDTVRGVELFDLQRPLGPAAPTGADLAAVVTTLGGEPLVGDLEPDAVAGWAVPVHVPVIRDGRLRFVLTVEVDPRSIQAAAAPRFPDGSVVAIVDREGLFVARSVGYPERLGGLSTTYVRQAIARGGAGIYRGRTLEGFSNYTAYTTSPSTGWSAHVAVSSGPFDAARRWSTAIWLLVAVGCVLLAAAIVGFTLRDIAKARREEERLRQSQKMEAVGHLTGGIAHDFNNLLTAIIGSLDLVLRKTELDPRSRRYVEGALDAARRGAKLTSRLLAFSRTQRIGAEPVDVAATVEGMRDLLDQSLGLGVSLAVDIAPDARWVLTDRNQLELALLNIAVNARDAMPDGGAVTIVSRLAETAGRRPPARPMVALSVTDTGQGMEPKVAEHAFDPFFTTKSVNKGTGLGLAQVYALARQSDGDAKILSQVGRGTQVTLLLPAAEAAAADAAPDAPGLTAAGAARGQRVLVLDDDDAVRTVMVESLAAAGFLVESAAEAEAALAALAGFDPHLVVLDFLMPGANGAEVAARIRQIRPKQKMLIVSGHLDTDALVAQAGDIPILAKPFDGEALVAFVLSVLRG
jgi:signal transduction histidine kinase/CheY-like chemotaxis protein